ncbi:MAG TPA: hypothetical protein VNV44_03030 [Solirubrobacteraceae bacterium]|jgi:hypothetical protein|nr:hypothetical protein [Solirubrobacteraceae bacterium]
MTMLQHEGSFPAQARPLPAAPAVPEPGVALRALARLRWFSLDVRLAAGEDPSRSRLLAAQAARLTDPRRRELLAAAIGGLLLAAERGPRAGRVTPSRSALLRNEASARELARRVDSTATLYARGLARLELLITDSTGPAWDGGPGELAAELERIETELSGGAAVQDSPRRTAAARARSARRLARMRAGRGRGSAPGAPGFAGDSFVLPDGSWFHGRRDSA